MKILAPLLVLCSCQSSLAASVDAFHEARYPDAARELRLARQDDLTEAQYAQYELYAGLVHLSLGSQRRAAVHLTRARELLERQPELFSAEEQGRLFRAWGTLGRLPGQPLIRQRGTKTEAPQP